MIFDRASSREFNANYPGEPSCLRHHLTANPLLALDNLIELTKSLPAESIEYNAGALPVEQDPDKTPMNGLSPEETVRRIRECNSWLVLKNIEQAAPYKNLLEECLEDVRRLSPLAIGPMHKKEGFIFISSPGAVTPFHMDPEHNILLQIAGEKNFHLFPANDEELISQNQYEAFHTEGGHRNLPYKESFGARGRVFDMGPGDALYVPVTAPHWVKVKGEVSVSLSITWRSRISDDLARLHRANAWLRAQGASPEPVGVSPLRDRAKILAQRVAARLGD